MDLRTLAHKASHVLIGNLGLQAIGLTALLVFTHNLSLVNFGIIALGQSIVAVISALCSSANWQLFVKFIGASNGKITSSQNDIINLCRWLDVSANCLALILAIVVIFPIWYFSGFANDQIAALAIILLALPFHSTGLPTGYFRWKERHLSLPAFQASGTILRLIGGIGTAIAGGGLLEFSIIYSASSIISCLMPYAMCVRLLRREQYTARPYHITLPALLLAPEIIYFFKWTSLTHIAIAVSRNINVVLVGFCCSASDAGLLRAAIQACSFFGTLSEPLYQASYPRLVILAKEFQLETIWKLSTRTAILLSPLLACTLVITFLWGDLLLGTIFGEPYAKSKYIFIILLFSQSLSTMGALLYPSLQSLGYNAKLTKIVTLSIFVQLSSLVILSHYYDAHGAAFASCIYSIVLNLSMTMALRDAIMKARKKC